MTAELAASDYSLRIVCSLAPREQRRGAGDEGLESVIMRVVKVRKAS